MKIKFILIIEALIALGLCRQTFRRTKIFLLLYWGAAALTLGGCTSYEGLPSPQNRLGNGAGSGSGTGTGSGSGSGISVIQNRTLPEMGEISLNVRGSRRWEFLATAADFSGNNSPMIELEARSTGNPALSDSTYAMIVRINGNRVPMAISRLRKGLQNKGPTLTSDQYSYWFLGLTFRVVRAADFSFTSAVTSTFGPEAFRFVLDVGPWTKVGNNQITIENTPEAPSGAGDLVVRNIRYLSLTPQNYAAGFTVSQPNSVARADVGTDGVPVLSRGPNQFPISTAFSTDNGYALVGPSAGLLGEVSTQFQGSTLEVVDGKNVFQGTIATPKYRIERTITTSSERAYVRDRIINTTLSDVHIRVHHVTSLPVSAENAYINGNPNPLGLQIAAQLNPTLYIPMGGFGLGLVAEDDTFRSQLVTHYLCGNQLSCSGTIRGGIRTERLLLSGGASTVMEWSGYAMPTGDYFDFINRVRNDWKVANATIPGPYWWFFDQRYDSLSNSEIADFVQRLGVAAAVTPGVNLASTQPGLPTILGLGTGPLDDIMAPERLRQVRRMERLNSVAPSVRVLAYNHYFYQSPYSDNGTNSFLNDRITNVDGTPYTETFTNSYARVAGVIPQLFSIANSVSGVSNAFGSAFKSSLNVQLAQFGADGIYFDESEFPGRLISNPITYNQGDGFSGIRNTTTGAITKVGYIARLSQSYRDALTDDLRADGYTVLANLPPTSRRNNAEGWLRISETSNLENGGNSHLYSPLAHLYTPGSYTIMDIRDRLEIGLLLAVTSPDDKLGAVGKLFPMTPVAIHRGLVEGVERIVTSYSGNFGWPGSYTGRIWIYDENGNLSDNNPPHMLLKGKVSIEVPPGGLAILERTQVSIPLDRRDWIGSALSDLSGISATNASYIYWQKALERGMSRFAVARTMLRRNPAAWVSSAAAANADALPALIFSHLLDRIPSKREQQRMEEERTAGTSLIELIADVVAGEEYVNRAETF